MIHNTVLIRKPCDQFFDIMLSLRRHTDVHDLGIHQTDCLQPGGAAARIGNQLGFINDGSFKMRAVIAQLNRGRNDLRVINWDGFFSRQHAAGNAGSVDAVEQLQCQETERTQIGPRQISLQVLYGVMCFAAVGRPDMQDKRSLQLPCALNIRVRGVFLKQRADFGNLTLFTPGSFPFLQYLGEFRALQRLFHLFRRPDADSPVASASASDPLHLRPREISQNLVFREPVFPNNLILCQRAVFICLRLAC